MIAGSAEREETPMEYLLLIHSDETATAPAPGTPGFEAYMAEWLAFNQRLIDGGHWIAAANLQPTGTATTLRRPGTGPTSIVDGPYAETKEQLGGFYLVSAAHLDQALEFAAAIPVPVGAVEVRPVAFRPSG